jgi:hypothetical protein
MRRLIAVAVAAGWLAAGCSTLAVDRFARVEEMSGPWRAEPMPVDVATAAAGEKACQDARPRIGREHLIADKLVAIDARGGARLTLIFAGPGNNYMECQLSIDAKGDFTFTGGVVQEVDSLLVAPNELAILGAGGDMGFVESSSVSGQIGAAITEVHVAFAAGGVLRASIGGGWFTAWWPNHDMSFTVEGFDASGMKITEANR